MARGVGILEKKPQLWPKTARFGGRGQEKFGTRWRNAIDRGRRGFVTMDRADCCARPEQAKRKSADISVNKDARFQNGRVRQSSLLPDAFDRFSGFAYTEIAASSLPRCGD